MARGDAAKRWRLISTYTDAHGDEVVVDPTVIQDVAAVLAESDARDAEDYAFTLVVRSANQTRLPAAQNGEWTIRAGDGVVGRGAVRGTKLTLSEGLEPNVYRLALPDGTSGNLVLAPDETYQGRDRKRHWLLAVQLYGIRSRRNWGHGDFTDLMALLELAAQLGAAGIGINPLHALAHDGSISPYSPSSRLFLNQLYIDVEKAPDGASISAETRAELARLREAKHVDYEAVALLKNEALRKSYEHFKTASDDRDDFDAFREERGASLLKYACFEALRARLPGPWTAWPAPWRDLTPTILDSIVQADGEEVAFHQYVQWVADRQLRACREKANALGLAVGLYMDVAIGVKPDGADVWSEPKQFLRNLSVGAPPDQLNVAGQDWGLTTYSSPALAAAAFEPFREMLAATMRYAGAVRLDHVLWLNRVYVIPNGRPPSQGCYMQYPLAALLATLALESHQSQTITVGEDLGTVPPELRAALREWGVWTYHVVQFEREKDGAFRDAAHYQERALATFSTHDLAPFSAWFSMSDLARKQEIGLDPGETEEEREKAIAALAKGLGLASPEAVEFAGIARFLAETPSRLVCISLEDALGSAELANIPGTIDEHPNWRIRAPVLLEELAGHPGLVAVAEALQGRN
jgi:4-alpha-glucanotransferase